MTEIIAGVYTPNETSKNSMGGTEQMALRMVRDIDPELLKHFHIIHSRVRDLPDNGLKKIFVAHDLHSDPEVQWMTDPDKRKQFDKLVFVSNWQLQMYNLTMGVPYSESVVMRNGIEGFDLSDINKTYNDTPIQIIYHTTPHRGLVLLPTVIKELAKYFKAEWHIYSSFGVYGWNERDKVYDNLFKELDSFDNVTLYGAQPNSVVRDRLKTTHIFAYPSIYPETSCLAAIEALCAGNFVIHPNYAALPETAEHNMFMYNFSEDINQHVNNFFNRLYSTCDLIKQQPDTAREISLHSVNHYNRIYEWNSIRGDWERLLSSLL